MKIKVAGGEEGKRRKEEKGEDKTILPNGKEDKEKDDDN